MALTAERREQHIREIMKEWGLSYKKASEEVHAQELDGVYDGDDEGVDISQELGSSSKGMDDIPDFDPEMEGQVLGMDDIPPYDPSLEIPSYDPSVDIPVTDPMANTSINGVPRYLSPTSGQETVGYDWQQPQQQQLQVPLASSAPAVTRPSNVSELYLPSTPDVVQTERPAYGYSYVEGNIDRNSPRWEGMNDYQVASQVAADERQAWYDDQWQRTDDGMREGTPQTFYNRDQEPVVPQEGSIEAGIQRNVEAIQARIEEETVDKMTDLLLAGKEANYDTVRQEVANEHRGAMREVLTTAGLTALTVATGGATAPALVSRLPILGTRAGRVGALMGEGIITNVAAGLSGDIGADRDIKMKDVLEDVGYGAAGGLFGGTLGELADVYVSRQGKRIIQNAEDLMAEKATREGAQELQKSVVDLDEVVNDLSKNPFNMKANQVNRALDILPEGELKTNLTAMGKTLNRMSDRDTMKPIIDAMADSDVKKKLIDYNARVNPLNPNGKAAAEKAKKEAREFFSSRENLLRLHSEVGNAIRNSQGNAELVSTLSAFQDDIVDLGKSSMYFKNKDAIRELKNLVKDSEVAVQEQFAASNSGLTALSRLMDQGYLGRASVDTSYLGEQTLSKKAGRLAETSTGFGIPADARKWAFNQAQNQVRNKAVDQLDSLIENYREAVKGLKPNDSNLKRMRHQINEMTSTRDAILKDGDVKNLVGKWGDTTPEFRKSMDDFFALKQYSDSFKKTGEVSTKGIETAARFLPQAVVTALTMGANIPYQLLAGATFPLVRQMSQRRVKNAIQQADKLLENFDGDVDKVVDAVRKMGDRTVRDTLIMLIARLGTPVTQEVVEDDEEVDDFEDLKELGLL